MLERLRAATHTQIFAFLTILFSVGFHLVKYDSIPFQFDELLMYELLVKNTYLEMLSKLYLKDIQQPFLYLITKGLGDWLGNFSWILRLPALLLTIYLPFFFYPLARRSLSVEDSLKATCLLLLSYPVVFFSSSMRPYVPVMAFSILATNAYLSYEERKTSFWVWNMLTFLTHPIGTLYSIALSMIVLHQERKLHPRLFQYFVTGLGIGLLAFLIIRGKDIFFVITSAFSLKDILEHYKRMSFIFSGKEFFIMLLALVATGFLRWKERITEHLDFFQLKVFAGILISGEILYYFSNNQIGGRHFILSVPALTILTIHLINAATDRRWLRNSLFILSILLMLHQSLIKEKIHTDPWEIDSRNMALKAIQLADSRRRIINCGNCLSYFIRSSQLDCVGGHLDKNWFKGRDQEFILIEMDYSKKFCGLNLIGEHYEAAESHEFLGGKVLKIVPRKLKD